MTPNDLPSDLARSRIMGAAETAKFYNLSVPHFRRLYRSGKIPRPIKISDRKLGWRVGDCLDHVNKLANNLEAAA